VLVFNNTQTNCVYLFFFTLLLHVSAAAASHHQGVQVAVTDVSLYQHLMATALTLSSLQTVVGFTV
jgi:hypothetical protein